ncbi:energy transducer TonB [Hymenobacter puniceus]|uniref:energy transducer TonB n=1 Tax=Hymenobacter sp. BT190 TaxID=2763505 RepID=UPI0016513369|nr:TonB family protein [Hymenobacter sp. BT190]MBC6697428.1 TonB family protein [Hymenobacter sp. BT190]
MPVLQGGADALRCFLYQNTQLSPLKNDYPSGKVFVGFIIDTTGQVRKARILQGLHPALDAEALRLANLLSGRFTPGQHNQQRVAVPFTLPIPFPTVAPAGRKQRKRCASSFTANTR